MANNFGYSSGRGNLYLIGYRATGKTTVGRLLAARLQRQFVDSDEEFCQHHGEIRAFVDNYGWPAFRRRETEVLRKISNRCQQVVATGGGVVLAEENRLLLAQSGIVWALTAQAETIYQRLLADTSALYGQRPALTGKNALWPEILATLAERQPLYLAAADHSIAVDDLEPVEVVECICANLTIRAELRGGDK